MDSGRRLWVVERLEVPPDLSALARPEPLLRRPKGQRGAELAAPALAEDPRNQRGDRNHVRDLPLVAGQADALGRVDQAVLARQLHRVGAGLVDELVDAGDVVVDVPLDHHARRPIQLVRAVVLELELRLVVGGVGPDRHVHGGVGAARERGELGAAGMAERVDHEQAVLAGDVAGPEHRSPAGRAVDVGNAERVAPDRHVVTRAVGAFDVTRPHPEARVLVVLGDLRGTEARRRVHQVPVHAELKVAGVGRVALAAGVAAVGSWPGARRSDSRSRSRPAPAAGRCGSRGSRSSGRDPGSERRSRSLPTGPPR